MQPPAVRVVFALLAVAVTACAGSRERPRSQTLDSSALPDCSDVVGDEKESALDPPEEVPEPDVEPVARNDEEILQALKENYPSELKETGRGGAVMLWIRIRDDGRVDSVTVAHSSAPASFDETAKEVARVMRFAPALDADGDPVATWVMRCITFAVMTRPDVHESVARARRLPPSHDLHLRGDGVGEHADADHRVPAGERHP